jgi:hypothetical protein
MKLRSKSHNFSLPCVSSFDELERQLLLQVAAFVSLLLEQCVAQIEAEWQGRDGAGYQSKGWSTRVVSSRLGELSIRRRKFYNSRTGHSIIPFDHHLQVRRETHTVKELSCRLSSEVSFAKASRMLHLLLGIHRSPKRVWRDLQEAGQALDEKNAMQANHMYETGEVLEAQDVNHPLLAIEADGTFVKGRRRGQVHEVKLAIAYTSKEAKSETRWVLQNKQVWGGVLPSAEFGRRLGFSLEQHYSLSTATRVIGRSDGGDWIANVFDSFAKRLTHQLDLHHLLRNILEAIKEPSAQAECIGLAYRGDGKALLTRLRRRVAHLQNPAELQATLRLIGYVRNNIDRIDSLAHFRESAQSEQERKMYCRGSGAIERNISAHICDRMKHRRMHWTPLGAHHMTQVRTALANRPQVKLFN